VAGDFHACDGIGREHHDDSFTFNIRHARGPCIGQVVRCFDHRERGCLRLRPVNSKYGIAVAIQGLAELGLSPVISGRPMIEAILVEVPNPAHRSGAKGG